MKPTTTSNKHIGLKKSDLNKVIESLQELLADYQVYYANVRGLHWNVKGPNFFVLHLQFEKLYLDAAKKVDQLAERILALGGTPESRFSKYLSQAHLKETGEISDAKKAIQTILESLNHFIEMERNAIDVAERAEDEGTADLLTAFLQDQEQLVWMFMACEAR